MDRGPGVEPEDRARIFEPFQRRGDSGTGVGLGLAVARGLTEAQGGTLEAESTPGGGLTMVLELPGAERVKVLLVDDDATLRRTLAIGLRAEGHEVLIAADGRTALQALREDRPDLVVLDLGLPDLSGHGGAAAAARLEHRRRSSCCRRGPSRPRRCRRSTSGPTTT